jgi:hypothetical protein
MTQFLCMRANSTARYIHRAIKNGRSAVFAVEHFLSSGAKLTITTTAIIVYYSDTTIQK